MNLLCISCIIGPTIYVNKHLSRLTYGRAPAKGSNPVVTRNRRIGYINKITNITFSVQIPLSLDSLALKRNVLARGRNLTPVHNVTLFMI